MLLELGLPSFDTLLYNSRVKFGNQVQCSQKSRPCYCAVAADFMICVCFLVVKFPETVKFQPKCTEFRLRLGLRPDPLWGLISPHAPFVIRRGDGWKGERDPQSLWSLGARRDYEWSGPDVTWRMVYSIGLGCSSVVLKSVSRLRTVHTKHSGCSQTPL